MGRWGWCGGGLVPREVVYEVEEEVRARLANVSFCGGMGGLGSRPGGGGVDAEELFVL